MRRSGTYWGAWPLAAWLTAATLGQQRTPEGTVRDEPASLARQSYMAHLAAADATLRLNESSATRRWLDGAASELRGWEWRYLNAQSDQSLGSFGEHAGGVLEIAFSRDGQHVASCDDQGYVMVRRVDGQELMHFRAHESACWRVAFSPDGGWLLTSSSDKTSRLWDAATGKELFAFREFQTPVSGAAFSPDGSMVATGNYTPLKEPPYVLETVKIWHPESGAVQQTLTAGEKPLSMLRWRPDGKRLAASSWSGTVNIWELGKPAPVLKLVVPEEGRYTALNCVAWSPDGARIIAGSKDHTARVWEAESGALLMTLPHSGWVTWASFSPDGQTIATAAHDNLIRLWDAASGKLQATLRGHTQAPWALAFSPDGKTLLTGGADGRILRWSTNARRYGDLSRLVSPGIYGMAWSADSRALITCAHDGRVRVLAADSLEVLREWQAHPNATANALGVSADGSRLVTCSWDKSARIWNTEKGELLHTLTHEQGITFASISPDGKTVATAPRGAKGAVLWDASRGERLCELIGHEGGVNEVCFSPDSRLVVTCGADKTARVWDRSTGSQRVVLRGNQAAVKCASFSPDGQSVVTGAADARVMLFNAASGVERWSNVVANSTVNRVGFSPDGARVACAAEVGPMLDSATGEVLMTLRPYRESGWTLAFSSDGERLAFSSTDGTVTICDTTPFARRE